MYPLEHDVHLLLIACLTWGTIALYYIIIARSSLGYRVVLRPCLQQLAVLRPTYCVFVKGVVWHRCSETTFLFVFLSTETLSWMVCSSVFSVRTSLGAFCRFLAYIQRKSYIWILLIV